MTTITTNKTGTKVLTVKDLPPVGSSANNSPVYLNDMIDVVISNVQNNDTISFDTATNKFINKSPSNLIDGGVF